MSVTDELLRYAGTAGTGAILRPVKTVAVTAGETFAVLFPLVDPIGNSPTFVALTRGLSAPQRVAVIRTVVVVVASTLIGFALIGEPLLNFFGISLEALQISGGLIVAYTGFRMVTAGEELVEQAATGNVAFAPLGIPLLAGPGAMAALLGLESREADQALGVAGTVIGVLLICVTVYVCFRSGELIARRLGPSGVSALNLIFGLLVLAIGIELIVHGIVNHGAVVQAHAPR
jgi:multiple antibiotic resistance protein